MDVSSFLAFSFVALIVAFTRCHALCLCAMSHQAGINDLPLRSLRTYIIVTLLHVFAKLLSSLSSLLASPLTVCTLIFAGFYIHRSTAIHESLSAKIYGKPQT